MRIRSQTAEYYLIVAALFFTFFYFVLRALVFDVFAWVSIVPVIGFLYMVRVGPRFMRFHLGGLDWVFLLYAVYGVTMTFVSIFLLSYSKTLSITTFVHFYAPTIVYFLARSYTRGSPANVIRVTNLVWVLAAILVVDVVIEYYVGVVRGTPLSIPWVRNVFDKIPYMTEELWYGHGFHTVRSILSGLKPTGMAAAALFAFIAPFFYMKWTSRLRQPWGRTWQFSNVLNATLLVGLIFVVFVVNNKTAMFAGIIALALGFVLTRSVKLLVFAALITAFGLAFQAETMESVVVSVFVQPEVSATGEKKPSTFETVVDYRRVLTGYAQTDVYTYILGQVSGTTDQTGLTESTFSEARGLAFPLYFGMGWTVIVAIGAALLVRYVLTLLRSEHWRVLGLALMGFFVIYFSDQHYPSFMRHGPFELFLVMAGMLSSARELVKTRATATRPRTVAPESDAPMALGARLG